MINNENHTNYYQYFTRLVFNVRYEIEENNKGSRITVSEKSKIENLFVRTMLTLAGRNANLKKEIKNEKN